MASQTFANTRVDFFFIVNLSSPMKAASSQSLCHGLTSPESSFGRHGEQKSCLPAALRKRPCMFPLRPIFESRLRRCLSSMKLQQESLEQPGASRSSNLYPLRLNGVLNRH